MRFLLPWILFPPSCVFGCFLYSDPVEHESDGSKVIASNLVSCFLTAFSRGWLVGRILGQSVSDFAFTSWLGRPSFNLLSYTLMFGGTSAKWKITYSFIHPLGLFTLMAIAEHISPPPSGPFSLPSPPPSPSMTKQGDQNQITVIGNASI